MKLDAAPFDVVAQHQAPRVVDQQRARNAAEVALAPILGALDENALT